MFSSASILLNSHTHSDTYYFIFKGVTINFGRGHQQILRQFLVGITKFQVRLLGAHKINFGRGGDILVTHGGKKVRFLPTTVLKLSIQINIQSSLIHQTGNITVAHARMHSHK